MKVFGEMLEYASMVIPFELKDEKQFIEKINAKFCPDMTIIAKFTNSL